MPIVRAQCILPSVSTVPRDTITNTWHFSVTDWNETIRGQIASELQQMYEAYDTFKGNQTNWGAARVKFFDLSEPEPRVPLDDISLGLSSAPSGSPMPSELSVCLSYRADYTSGSSQSRRRGRVYLGTLNMAALTSDGRLSSTLQTNLATAAAAFLVESNTASEWTWVVWSPSAGQAYNVSGGWIDNAPDIQRRRGVQSTSRVLFS